MRESWATNPHARATMVANRSRDTKPERAVRSILHQAGLRYRVSFRPESAIRRTADIVFTRHHIAVFIDGCYWHGCPEHFVMPKSNVEYWKRKIRANRDRDIETTILLTEAGWIVLRFWEHDAPVDVARSIQSALRKRTAIRPSAGSGHRASGKKSS